MQPLPAVPAQCAVVIPVYRAENYLAACLDSVLSQSRPHLRVIAVDDGSPDGSAAILESYARRDPRVLVLRQENRGVAAARNTGLREALRLSPRPEYVFFLDADDELAPGALESLVESLESSQADCAVGAVEIVTRRGKPSHRPPMPVSAVLDAAGCAEQFFRIRTDGTTLPHDACEALLLTNRCFRLSFVEGTYFDESLRRMEDQDWYIRLLGRMKSAVLVPRTVLRYRRRCSSLSNGRDAKENDFAVIRRFHERRREFPAAVRAGLQHSFFSHLRQELLHAFAFLPAREARQFLREAQAACRVGLEFPDDARSQEIRRRILAASVPSLRVKAWARRLTQAARRLSNRWRYFA